MVLCIPVAIFYNEGGLLPMAISAIVTGISGLLIRNVGKNTPTKELEKKDGYLVVSLGWIVMSLFGCLPCVISGEIPVFTDAFFETISGYTTTGASILNDIEAVPKGLLLWRSLTQWIGGMGIIVLAVAILPFLGIGGMQLFVAEAPNYS